jgi:hypothetical protein
MDPHKREKLASLYERAKKYQQMYEKFLLIEHEPEYQDEEQFDEFLEERSEADTSVTNDQTDGTNDVTNDTNGLVDSSNGLVDSSNGLVDSSNGLVDSSNGLVDSSNGTNKRTSKVS